MGVGKSADGAAYVEQLVDSTGATATVSFAETGAQTLNYNADGTLNYIQVTNSMGTWRQTFSYTSGKVTAISEWVKQ